MVCIDALIKASRGNEEDGVSKLADVRLDAIDPNPHRRMETYPLNRRKIDALKQSIDTVGLWEGVIVRPSGNRFQCAFGHHRLAAAREQLGENADIKVIIRDLDDGEMLKFMGRENGEDFNTEFLVMLETWEAAMAFLDHGLGNQEAVETARFLGWTQLHPDGAMSNQTARTCEAAVKLIKARYLSREDLVGLSVRAAREICQSTLAHHEALERAAARQERDSRARGDTSGTTDKHLENVKREYAAAARTVAQDVREGRLGATKARGEIWSRADIRVREKQLPDFGNAMRGLRRRVEGYFDADFMTRIKEVCAVAEHVRDEDERAEYGYLAGDIREAIDRADRCADRLEKAGKGATVAHLRTAVDAS